MILSKNPPIQNSHSSDKAVSLAAAWLTHSGIQHNGTDKNTHGGVAAWYELDKKIYPFIYSEITGYALSCYVFLKKITAKKSFLSDAESAAAWLMNHAHHDRGIKTRYYLVKHYVSPNYCFHHGRIYAFDTAMVGYGILQLYKETNRPAYLQFAHELLHFLIDRMRRKDGLFYAYYDSKAKNTGEDFEKWSDQSGTFHAKLALFMIDYALLTRDSRFEKYAVTLLDAVKSRQERDGRFVTGQADQSTHLHPHAYTLEGLLYGGVHLKRKDYLQSALRGFEWMLKGVSNDGSVSSIYAEGTFSYHERSDIVAQTLRIGAVLCALYPESMKLHEPLLQMINEHLPLFQYHGQNKKQAGGFIYGAATDGLIREHLNAWATMFALQALWMYREFVENRKRLSLESFV